MGNHELRPAVFKESRAERLHRQLDLRRHQPPDQRVHHQRSVEEQRLGELRASFFGYDGGGSVRLLTDASGTVTDTYEYDAFGNALAISGSTPNEYLYRGEQYDSDLSLYYLRARYYNPVTGRFVSRDPLAGEVHSPASFHTYQYAEANPVNMIDPSGKGAVAEAALNLGPRYGDKVAEVTEFGLQVSCIYFAEAEAIDLVNHWTQQGRMERYMGVAKLGLMVGACSADLFKAGREAEIEPLAEEEEEAAGFCCFAAGTPVHTDHGEVPIEKIKAGDRVYSRNRETGKTELEPVTQLTQPHLDHLIEVRVEGEAPPLRPAADHPFWVKRSAEDTGHWIQASDLRTGELLETLDGNWRKIESITPVKGGQTVYNFTVAKDHDYFVGETGFLVHNQNCGCRPTWLYAMNGGDGQFLKWGISYNPLTRYSQRFLNTFGGTIIPIMSGNRQDMLDMERFLTERYPGPLNKEPWAGCKIGEP